MEVAQNERIAESPLPGDIIGIIISQKLGPSTPAYITRPLFKKKCSSSWAMVWYVLGPSLSPI